MKTDTRAMQDRYAIRHALVLDGEALWKRKLGAANKGLADCPTMPAPA